MTLHPWLSTHDALTAARNSVAIPMTMMGGWARAIGADELLSEALAILTECAVPPEDQTETVCARCGGSLDQVRKGAKFCSTTCRTTYGMWVHRNKAFAIPPRTLGHVGSMWGWPAEDMQRYAIREVGYVLNNWLRTRSHVVETPTSEYLAEYAAAE